MTAAENVRPVLGAFDAAALDARRLAPLLWDPVAAATLARSRPGAGERVLDACCGTGPSALPAALAVGADGIVDAVDLAASAVGLLAGQAAGLPQLRPRVGDVTTWEPAGYDVVQCVLGIFFLPDPAAGTGHLVHRAREGGRVALTIWQRDALVPAGRALLAAVSDVRGTSMPVPAPSEVVQRLGDREAFASWLLDRGLVDVEVDEAPLTFPVDAESLWLLVQGSGFRGMLAGLDDEAVERARRGYLERLVDGPPVDATSLVGWGRRR